MACGCGAKARPIMQAVARSTPNMYMLAGYADCTETYQGPRSGTAIFVVAPATPNEKLFAWEDYDAAVEYATGLGISQIDNVVTTSLCQQAVESVYPDA